MSFSACRGHTRVSESRSKDVDDVASVQQGMTPKPPDLGDGEAIAFTADGHQLATIAEGGRTPLSIFRAP